MRFNWLSAAFPEGLTSAITSLARPRDWLLNQKFKHFRPLRQVEQAELRQRDGPQGTASNLTDESMLSFAANLFLLNEGMPFRTISEGQDTVDFTEGLVQVIIWSKPTAGLKGLNPVYRFGHVSFVIGDQAYSWQAHIDPKTGQEDWYVSPANDYIRGKLPDGSHGTGYYLNFGSREANDKFRSLLLNAYNNFAPDGKRWGYSLTQNNCGDAFKRAINGMGLQGVASESAIKPSSHQWFIENVLVPRGIVVAMRQY